MPAGARALPVTPPRPYLWAQHTTATSTGAEKKPKSLPPAKPHIPPPRPGTGEGAPRRRRDPQPGLLLLLPPRRWPRAEEGAGGGAGGEERRARGEGRRPGEEAEPPSPSSLRPGGCGADLEPGREPAAKPAPLGLLRLGEGGDPRRGGQRRRGKRSVLPRPSPGPTPARLPRRPEPLSAGLRAAGPGKPPPHLRGSEPRIPKAQQSQMASGRARSPEHMAPLLRPNLGGIRCPPQSRQIPMAKRGSPPLPPPTGFPARPIIQPLVWRPN